MIGVSAAIFRENKVLLAQRGRGWRAGLWSFPGGRLEAGETMRDAVAREAMEEIGVRLAVGPFVDHVEVIERDETGEPVVHFIVCVFLARILEGEPATGPEASAIAWCAPSEVAGYDTTPGLAEVAAEAARLHTAEP